MNTQNTHYKRALVSPSIRSVINTIDSGEIDSLLKQLERTPFGVYVNAHVVDGVVEPVPLGSSLSESNLEISLTSNKQEQGAVKVGYYASGGFICSGCDSPNDCRSHSNPKANDSDRATRCFPVLDGARELIPESLDLEKFGDLLSKLSKYNLGIFLCHGHNKHHAFTELPLGCVAVVENGRTEFRAREDVIFDERFLPNVWRMENGAREVVGGFLASEFPLLATPN